MSAQLLEPAPGLVQRPPEVSLATTARRLPDGVNWKSGISARQTTCPSSSRWRYCPIGDEEKIAPSGSGVASFLPFTIYLTLECDEATPSGETELEAELRAQAEASTPWHLARELWTGAFNSAAPLNVNPSLQAPFPGSVPTFPLASILTGTQDPVEAVAHLYAAYEEATRHGGGAIIHMPSVLVPFLLKNGIVRQEGSLYRGPNFLVSPGPGYPTTAGTFGPSGLAAAANQVWVFITGPVEYDLGTVDLEPALAAARRWDRRMNRFTMLAERQAILRFDPCSTFAVLVSTPTTE